MERDTITIALTQDDIALLRKALTAYIKRRRSSAKNIQKHIDMGGYPEWFAAGLVRRNESIKAAQELDEWLESLQDNFSEVVDAGRKHKWLLYCRRLFRRR